MESKKLTQQELDRVNNIKKEYDNLTVAFGQLEIQIAELESQKQQLKEKYSQVRKQENDLGTHLEKTYGKGNINLETGEFIPR